MQSTVTKVSNGSISDGSDYSAQMSALRSVAGHSTSRRQCRDPGQNASFIALPKRNAVFCVSVRTQDSAVISTILFDLDGTLYDRDLVVQSLATVQYQEYRDRFQNVEEGRYIRRLIELDDHGYKPKHEVYEMMGREMGLAASLQQELEAHFWAVYDDFCTLPDDARETLETLRIRGKKLGIVTNGRTNRQHAKIDALGIRSLFDAIVVSEEVGFRKPDPQIFRCALELCSASPEQAIHVGDHPDADIEGAVNAGLQAVWKAVPYWELKLSGVPKIDRLGDVLRLTRD